MPEWENNLFQFTMVLRALIRTGAMTFEMKKTIATEMELTIEEVDELIARAVESADELERRM